MTQKINWETLWAGSIIEPKRTRKPAKRRGRQRPIFAKITAAMVREYNYRELTDAPFNRFTAPGEYTVTAAEAAKIINDSEYHGDVNGCSGIEHPASTKAMYRRLHRFVQQSVKAAEART